MENINNIPSSLARTAALLGVDESDLTTLLEENLIPAEGFMPTIATEVTIELTRLEHGKESL